VKNISLLIAFIFLAASAGYCDEQAKPAERHYFQHADAKNCSLVNKGDTKEEVRKACGGHEYPPFETVRDGFSFSLNADRSKFFTFPKWMPPSDKDLDFFIAGTEFFLVYYQKNKVTILSEYPLTGATGEYEQGSLLQGERTSHF
jgi:hypothetical protein